MVHEVSLILPSSFYNGWVGGYGHGDLEHRAIPRPELVQQLQDTQHAEMKAQSRLNFQFIEIIKAQDNTHPHTRMCGIPTDAHLLAHSSSYPQCS